MEEEWENINVEVQRDKKEFKLTQFKLDHYYWNSGDLVAGMPISTSVELTSNYNFESNKLEWKKIISHTFVNLENEMEYSTNTHEETIDENIIKEIEKYDLRDLKNNYFTEENPERFSHWEITYNDRFKIVGTYDQVIDEILSIKNILNFNQTMEEENNKIDE